MSSDNSIESRIASLTPREGDVFERLAHGGNPSGAGNKKNAGRESIPFGSDG